MSERKRLAQIARQQAEADRRYAAERAQVPDEIQERMLRDACDFFGIEPPPSTKGWNPYYDWSKHPLDPLAVRHTNKYPYTICEYDHSGITLIGHYLWGGGNSRYHRTSSPWTVTRKRWLGRQNREAWNLGDIADWLE